jgi:aminoglycoside phosphotransferase
MQQLKNVYPWRRRKITELQNKIWRAESLQQWLSELIIQGTQATQQLEED